MGPRNSAFLFVLLAFLTPAAVTALLPACVTRGEGPACSPQQEDEAMLQISASSRVADDTQPKVACPTETPSELPPLFTTAPRSTTPPTGTVGPVQTTAQVTFPPAVPKPVVLTTPPPTQETTAAPGSSYYYPHEEHEDGSGYYYPHEEDNLAFIIVKIRGLCGEEGEVVKDPANPRKPYRVRTAADCASLAEGGNRDRDAPDGGWKAFAMGVAGSPADHQCKMMKLYPYNIKTAQEMQGAFETWEGQDPDSRECPFGGWVESDNWDFFVLGTSAGRVYGNGFR